MDIGDERKTHRKSASRGKIEEEGTMGGRSPFNREGSCRPLMGGGRWVVARTRGWTCSLWIMKFALQRNWLDFRCLKCFCLSYL